MSEIQKKPVSSIVSSVLGGAILAVSSQAMAVDVFLPSAKPGVISKPHVAEDHLGQVGIVPYYTVRAGQRTLFNVMNTSGDSIAVKAVFRRALDSKDVLNFWIVMSPYDAWTGQVMMHKGKPVLRRSKDEDTCVVGAFGSNINNNPQAMQTFVEPLRNPSKNADPEELTEGYVTFIAAGKVDTGFVTTTKLGPITFNEPTGLNYAKAIKHGSNGVPGDCNAVAKPFTVAAKPLKFITAALVDDDELGAGSEEAGEYLDNLFLGLGPEDNPLKVNFAILDIGDGIAGGGPATMIAAFNQSTKDVDPLVPAAGAAGVTVNSELVEDLVTAQVTPFFYEPTLASGGGIWEASKLGDLEDALATHSIINEWTDYKENHAESDWVVTLPTKGFRVNGTTLTLNDVRKGITYSSGYDKVFYSYKAWDREEKTAANAPTPSPNIFEVPYLPREANVLSFRQEENGIAISEGPLSSFKPINFPLRDAISGTPNGWMKLDLNEVTIDDRNVPVAAVGFMFKALNQENTKKGANFGQIIEHSLKKGK